MEDKYIVYVRVNELGHIVEINSSAFISDTTGWIEIDSGMETNTITHKETISHSHSMMFEDAPTINLKTTFQ